MGMTANINAIHGSSTKCNWRWEAHLMEQCPSNPESVNYIGNFNRGQNNPYSNSYNPGWRNHPNFSWGGNQGVPAGPRPSQPPGFQ